MIFNHVIFIQEKEYKNVIMIKKRFDQSRVILIHLHEIGSSSLSLQRERYTISESNEFKFFEAE
jgi:hypothetical protein